VAAFCRLRQQEVAKIVQCGEKIEEEAICKGGLSFLTVNILTGFLINLNQNAVANTDLSLEPSLTYGRFNQIPLKRICHFPHKQLEGGQR
jgi:hypothetical protein